MTIKFGVSIIFSFNIKELIRHIKYTIYFTWNTWAGSVLHKWPGFYLNMTGSIFKKYGFTPRVIILG
jgi:hypothetical protein